MSTQLIRPSNAEPLEIRCNVGDAMVANLAVHIIFFFERRLDTTALARAFAQALTNLPIFAGRMALVGGAMRIRLRAGVCPSRLCRRAAHSVTRSVLRRRTVDYGSSTR